MGIAVVPGAWHNAADMPLLGPLSEGLLVLDHVRAGQCSVYLFLMLIIERSYKKVGEVKTPRRAVCEMVLG